MTACCCLFAKLCLTLCDPMDRGPPGSSVYGNIQARILEWVAISFSRGSTWTRDQTHVFCIIGTFFTSELPGKSLLVVRSCYSLLVVSMKSKNILLSARNNPISFKMVSPEFRLYCNTIVLLRFSVKDNHKMRYKSVLILYYIKKNDQKIRSVAKSCLTLVTP